MGRHSALEKVIPASRKAGFHFSEQGDYLTLCGRNREGWTASGPADLRTDLDDPGLCKRCRDAI